MAFWPVSTRAQQTATAVRRIAVLLRVAKDDPDAQRDLEAFREELQKLGWTTDRTIRIEYRYASGDAAQMQTYAAEMVRLPAEVVLREWLARGGCHAARDTKHTNRIRPGRRSAQPRYSSRASRIRAAT